VRAVQVNPFDFRTVVFAKHAQHVVLIHFPIAVFITAVAFDYLAQWTKNRTVAAAASFNMLLAAVSTVPAVATGFAMGARGANAERDSVDAPGARLLIECGDLAGVLDPLACAAPSGGVLANIPPSIRSRRGTTRRGLGISAGFSLA
jgi:predicted membrane protein DUF2231